MIIACIISYIISALIMFCAILLIIYRDKKPQNKVHFYVVRDSNNELGLWFGKPYRGIENWVCVGYSVLIADDKDFNLHGLNIDDFKNLKWEDEPVEVFLNSEN